MSSVSTEAKYLLASSPLSAIYNALTALTGCSVHFTLPTQSQEPRAHGRQQASAEASRVVLYPKALSCPALA